MNARYPKRLIEVDLPIARISAHARREKSIRHGHISTLHIWWARRPLAACRAVICAALWPDPADPLCPQAFRDRAAMLVMAFARRVFPKRINEESRQLQATASKESLARWELILKKDEGERLKAERGSEKDECAVNGEERMENEGGRMKNTGDDAHSSFVLPPLALRGALLDFIADFANWDNSTVPAYLETSRALTQAAHEALGGEPGTRPLVVDPFAGGGSIPLEALRVGADVFASDLNPVAVLLNKVVLEYIPKYGQRLADEVRKWGEWVKDRAEKELAEFYPKDPDGATPIAYLWARTIRCEGPGCGAEVPLVARSTIARRTNGSFALSLSGTTRDNGIQVAIVESTEAKSAIPTCKGFVVTCPRQDCGYSTPKNSVQRQLSKSRGGADTARLMAVLVQGGSGRCYRLPNSRDLAGINAARDTMGKRGGAEDDRLIPNELVPAKTAHRAVGSQLPLYGFTVWGDLFTARQKLSITTLQKTVRRVYSEFIAHENESLARAVFLLLAFALDKQADYSSSLCRWVAGGEFIAGTLAGEKKFPMISDFAESNPVGPGSGSWDNHIDWIARFIEKEAEAKLEGGTVCQVSADEGAVPSDSAAAFITDPPYYDSVPYADLSDYFYVWLRRTLQGIEPLSDATLTPKDREITVNHPQNQDEKTRYENLLTCAFTKAREATCPSGIGVIVFAHKSTSGWETLLEAIIKGGWIVTGSWPIDTERTARPNALETASLNSSVHLVCRPREDASGAVTEAVGEWRDVLAELPKRIHEWMPRLASEGVVGADAIFACLGPALEIFSRYSRVEKANGDAVPLREYLEQVWAAVSTEALTLIFADADAAGLEPEARLTAMWLWTLGGGAPIANGKVSPSETSSNDDAEENASDNEEESTKSKATGGYTLEFDAARKIAQGLGIHLERSESIVEVKGDKARLLPVSERTRYLFGKNEESAVTARGKKKKAIKQRSLFEELDTLEAESEGNAGNAGLKPSPGETVLDRVHQAMILFAAGRGEALRRFLVEDGAGTDARFWKLAQSFSALYPNGTDEKRWVDGVLARKKGLGL